jgi:hypothetical protein
MKLVESLSISNKLRFLKAITNGLQPNIFIESDFFTYLKDEEEVFILFNDQWCNSYKVNYIEVNKDRFNAIETICRHFFNDNEYLIIQCPKGQ